MHCTGSVCAEVDMNYPPRQAGNPQLIICGPSSPHPPVEPHQVKVFVDIAPRTTRLPSTSPLSAHIQMQFLTWDINHQQRRTCYVRPVPAVACYP